MSTTKPDTDAPERCPFCGVLPTVVAEYETLPPQPLSVMCKTQGCALRGKIVHIDQWNTRASTAPAPPPDSHCAHCDKDFVSVGDPNASLCAPCFMAGHRGFVCGKYCVVTDKSLALAQQWAKDYAANPTASPRYQATVAHVTAPAGEGEADTFHRGVDAAKEAIRSEPIAEEHESGHYFAALFINAIARKCGFDRAATPSSPAPDAIRRVWDKAISLIPTNWLDSLLTGPDASLQGNGGTWGCPDVERLLQGVKARLEAARDAAPIPAPDKGEVARRAAEKIAGEYKELLTTGSHLMHSKVPAMEIEHIASIIEAELGANQ